MNAPSTQQSPLPLTPPASVGTAEFRQCMARMAGAVNVVTTDGPAGIAGFTASAVCSVTDSPPTVLVCMNRGSFAHPFFQANGVLCVNVLSAGQEGVSALFSDRSVPMPERFQRTPWVARASGAPGLEGSLVQLDGRIVATHEVGTHSVFIVQLGEVRTEDAGAAPCGLAYFDRRYHALGAAAA